MSFKIGYSSYMIVCHCTGVTDSAIRQMARDGAKTVADIARRSGAGGCCAPCRDEIAELLDSARSDHVADARI